MGRRRYSGSSRPPLKKTPRPKMKTKKQLADLPQPSSYYCQDVPVKVRRSLARRAGLYGGPWPIFYQHETSLSELYNDLLRETYIDQIFTSVTKIGQGCFGDVFQATSKEDGKMYAIKVTNDTHAFIDLSEVRRWEKISEHKNCVKFFRAWQESYRLYIQMELCMTSLDKLAMIDHFIREPQCWDILTDISAGLKHLHDRELIHLDIKPANVMITVDGICKLGDFGLLLDLQEVNPDTLRRQRTGVSVSEGDGKYVALEVLQDNTFTKAGDIFSLGLMMLEVASDAALASSGTIWVDIRDGILPQCYLRRKLSSSFRKLIAAMIQKDYTQRPSINEVMQNQVVVHTLAAHNNGTRTNYLANWREMWARYVDTQEQNKLDIPVQQIEGPSPPRRSYPINYVPPRSPLRRTPLRELGINRDVEPGAVDRFARARRISRRLFF